MSNDIRGTLPKLLGLAAKPELRNPCRKFARSTELAPGGR